MPAFIIGGAIALGSALWSNKKRKDAAEDAQAAMNQQLLARNRQKQEALAALDSLMSGEVPIPIKKVEVEKGKIGEGLLDALDTAKSDESINQQINQSEKALSAQLNVSDPRVKAAIGQKAVDKFNDQQAEIQAQGKEDITQAQTQLGSAQTANEQDFSRRKQQAEQDYANQANQFVSNEFNRLQDLIGDQTEAGYDLRYGADTIIGQTQAQNAADFSSAVMNVGSSAASYGAAGGFGESGMKLGGEEHARFLEFLNRTSGEGNASIEALMSSMPNADQIKARNARRAAKNSENDGDSVTAPEQPTAQSGMRFSKEMGGRADMTTGEFNHGPKDSPESGNDQVLLDQEDLKKVMDQGGVNSFDELMGAVPPQAVTTGGELIFNDDDSGEIEKRTMATDPNEGMDYARKGAKNRKKKKSKAEIRKAEAALAAYMRNLLGQEQFQG
jgi:hypothetical protein